MGQVVKAHLRFRKTMKEIPSRIFRGLSETEYENEKLVYESQGARKSRPIITFCKKDTSRIPFTLMHIICPVHAGMLIFLGSLLADGSGEPGVVLRLRSNAVACQYCPCPHHSVATSFVRRSRPRHSAPHNLSFCHERMCAFYLVKKLRTVGHMRSSWF